MIMANEVKTATKLTVNDVMGRLERVEPVFLIDARNPQAWSQSDAKLPGALRVPAGAVARHLSEIPRDRTVIAYCT
jgi:rhodanese-related sulfurtransferase